jgi:hypothetical protein
LALLTAFSPAGLTGEGQARLADQALDTAAQAGTSSHGSEENDLSRITESLQAMTTGRLGFGNQRSYAGNRDPYFKSKARNSLKELKSLADLQERLATLQFNSDLVLAQVQSNIKAVLLGENFSYPAAGSYAASSPYLKISQASLEAFTNLHMHLVGVSLNRGWEFAQMELEYHTKKLAAIRAVYQTRLQIVCHVYCYLRDQSKAGWQSLAIQGLQLKTLMSQLDEPSTAGNLACGPGGGFTGCIHCKSCLHVGGRANCPWSRLSAKKAQTSAKAAYRKVAGLSVEALRDLGATDVNHEEEGS